MLSLFAISVFADEKPIERVPDPEESLKPITRHILAPRTFIDLCGTQWEVTTVRCTKEEYPDPKDPEKKKTRWNRTPIADFNALKWKPFNLPRKHAVNGHEYTYFRRIVELPNGIENKRLVIHFEKVIDNFRVFLNGKVFEGNRTWEMPWDVDLSGAAKAGQNELIIEICGDWDRHDWADSPFQHVWALSPYFGICRPLHLEIMDPVYLEAPIVRTRLNPSKNLELIITAQNHSNQEVKAHVEASVIDSWSQKTPELTLPAKGSVTFVITQQWESVELWDPEHPKLYHLDLGLFANGRKTDAFRQRFGFREVSMRNQQFLLNGKPYIHRRTTHPENRGIDFNSLKESILVNRANGTTGFRLFGGDWVRWIDAADEVGAMVTPVAPGGGGAAWKSDKFWEVFAFYQAHLIRTFINSPSVLAWALGNEFGTIYGGNEGGPLEEPTSKKQALLGKKAEQLDPTRGWTYCGEVDIGFPVKGTVGPAPIRSFHYPIGSSREGITFPESGYWYAKNELSWHRISTHDKPLVISEDVYHGTTDQFYGMSKAGGDSILTLEGYADTLRYIIRCFTEGHYFAGLGGWETWVTYQGRGDKNMINQKGGLMPNFLITTRENFPNLSGGKPVVRNLYCYNQLFTKYDCDLVREDSFEGQVVYEETRKFSLDQGEKHHEQICLVPPAVSTPKTYSVKFTLKTGDRILTERVFDYTVFPRTKVSQITIPGEPALLLSESSILRKAQFTGNIFTNATEALASKPSAIVIDAVLTSQEGRALTDYVIAGGKICFIESPESSWSPLNIDFNRPFASLFKRNSVRLSSLEEPWMKAWAPDHTLGHASYPKPNEDAAILWDCGFRPGLSNTPLLWVNRGQGAWLLCQLPVLSRFDIEPAAPFVLQAVLNEFNETAPVLTRQVVVSPGTPVADLLKSFKIESATKVDATSDVLLIDASKKLDDEQLVALEAHTEAGGTVVILEPQVGDCDALLEKLKLSLTPYEQKQAKAWGKMRDVDTAPRWSLFPSRTGLAQGLSAFDTLWFPDFGGRAEGYWMKQMCGETNVYFDVKSNTGVHTGNLTAHPGSTAQLFGIPTAFAQAEYNKGSVVLVPLKFSELASKTPELAGRTLRTLLNNLGVRTSKPERVHDYAYVDIAHVANRGYWSDPLYKDANGIYNPPGWFNGTNEVEETQNDLRYFPVNLCGWSMQARNFCPREEFPTEPLNLGGMKFKLQDPSKNKGKGIIVLEPRQRVTVQFPKAQKVQKIYFLGAKAGFDKNTLEMTLPSVSEPIVFESGKHFDIFRWTCNLPEGSLAWCGGTQKDDQASLYHWYGINPIPEKEITSIQLTNQSEKGMIGILGITLELTDAQ